MKNKILTITFALTASNMTFAAGHERASAVVESTDRGMTCSKALERSDALSKKRADLATLNESIKSPKTRLKVGGVILPVALLASFKFYTRKSPVIGGGSGNGFLDAGIEQIGKVLLGALYISTAADAGIVALSAHQVNSLKTQIADLNKVIDEEEKALSKLKEQCLSK